MKEKLIVVFEAIDAGGKATQSKLLAERLGGTRFSFPNYESPTGKLIGAHLRREWEAKLRFPPTLDMSLEAAKLKVIEINNRLFQSLQTVNRIELIPDIIEAQRKGPIVYDRYWPSAVVYGEIDGLERSWLLRTQRDPLPQADVFILLDVPVEESFKRRPEGRDRYEANPDLLSKVRAGYLKLWTEQRSNPHRNDCWIVPCTCDVRAWEIVDGMGSVEAVRERVNAAVDRHRQR